jgi:hypothetical protein
VSQCPNVFVRQDNAHDQSIAAPMPATQSGLLRTSHLDGQTHHVLLIAGVHMRTGLVLAVAVSAAVLTRGALAQSAADSAAIRATALDYVEGWYEGNAERMGRAVHPELVKRIIVRDTVTGRAWISNQGWGNLVAGTARGGGKNTPMAERRKDVKILDIYGNVAAVRATMSGWIDYMQMAKVDNRWQIVNVLWEMHPPKPR